MEYLLKKSRNESLIAPATLLEPQALGILSNPLRIKILQMLAERPMYPAELATRLRMHEQKVYYHVKQMSNAGLIAVTSKKEIKGTVAKTYAPTSMNFGVALGKDWSKLDLKRERDEDPQLTRFFAPFLKDGRLDAHIVVGSPEPHGRFKAHARDAHYAIDLALLIGQLCDLPKQFTVKLDVDIKMEKEERSNLIIIGGPGPNILAYDINDHLPVRFDIKAADEGFYCSGIISTRSGRKINDETAGIIARIRNPFDPSKMILYLAGYRFAGAKSAVIALTRHHKQLLARWKGQDEFCVVVKGFDLDGDGKIDSVEIIE